jgi:hypothetical protein
MRHVEANDKKEGRSESDFYKTTKEGTMLTFELFLILVYYLFNEPLVLFLLFALSTFFLYFLTQCVLPVKSGLSLW